MNLQERGLPENTWAPAQYLLTNIDRRQPATELAERDRRSAGADLVLERT